MSRLPLLGLLLAVGLVAAGCGESKQTRAEVDAARAYRPSLFSTFPATEGKRSCRIPFLDEPSWPRGHVGLVARGKVYVELLLRQPGVFITPLGAACPGAVRLLAARQRRSVVEPAIRQPGTGRTGSSRGRM